MSQRRKILRMSTNFLQALLGRDLRRCIYEVTRDGLPPDTAIVNAQMSPDFRTLVVLLESEEFDEVPEDSPYPAITPMFRWFELPERSTTEAMGH